jgi:hypothetical protein
VTKRATAPDPVADPEAYRQSLLDHLGDDDPAAVQAAGPAAVRALIDEAGILLGAHPEPNEWSVLECIAHLVDSELVSSVRYRWILAEEEPDIVGYEQDRWVSQLHQGEEDPAVLASVFDALRRWNLGLWASHRGSSERVGVHRERGRESYGLIFRLAAGHDRVHLGQARRTLEAARASSED